MKNSQPSVANYFTRDRAWHPKAYAPGYKSSVLRAPMRSLIAIGNSLSETTGPAFGHDIIGPLDNDLILNFAQPGESAIGERIMVHGRVLDERGQPVPGVLLEFTRRTVIWRHLIRISAAADVPYRAMMVPMPSAPSVPAPTPGQMAPMTGAPRISTFRCSVRPSPSA